MHDHTDSLYPTTDPDAPITTRESPYVKGTYLKQGHCGGPVGSDYHSGRCTVISWHKQSSTWSLCACDCHEQTEAQLRALALEYHTKNTEGRQRMAVKQNTKKKSTPARSKSATPAREARACLCECGDKTKGGKFLPGHDAKLKSRLQNDYRAAKNKRERDKVERVFTDLKWGKFIPTV